MKFPATTMLRLGRLQLGWTPSLGKAPFGKRILTLCVGSSVPGFVRVTLTYSALASEASNASSKTDRLYTHGRSLAVYRHPSGQRGVCAERPADSRSTRLVARSCRSLPGCAVGTNRRSID